MAERLRAFDWDRSAFGAVVGWPSALKSAVDSMLDSQCPTAIAWGAELRLLYNDAYRTVLGPSKHPAALGCPAREVFREGWSQLGPSFERAQRGEAVAVDDLELTLIREGYLENCWFASFCSPIRGSTGDVAGVLSLQVETTKRVEEQRRLTTLRDLLRHGLEAHSVEQICRRAARVFESNRVDVPFALFYVFSDEGRDAERVASVGLSAAHPGNFQRIFRTREDLRAWPIFEAAESRQSLELRDLAERFGWFPGGPYEEPAHSAVLLPLAASRRRPARAVLIAGVSPRRALDRSYRTFLELCAEQISQGIARVEKAELHGRRSGALREAERANRAKDEFLALLGHELRNPLAPILTAIELMKLKDAKLLERERSVIERQARHMVQLVDDLLDVSRVTRGKIQLRLEPIEIATAIGQAVEMVSPLFEQRQHRLSVSVPKTGLPVQGDPFRLAQVFANLLTNSAKYTPVGGQISVSARVRAGMVEVRIRDNGSGIARSMLERIFEPFVQGARSADGSSGGLGLGLPLVRSLVALHEGTVYAHSEGLGRGSEFSVELPLLGQKLLAGGALGASEARPGNESSRRRLLVVDDNADAAEMTAEGLRVLGYQVRVAFDAESALEVALEFRPECAVLDIGLPIVDGYELGRRLREALGEELMLIAVTGYGQEGDRERSRREQFAEHLVKPIDLALLARCLKKKRAETEPRGG